MATYATVEHKVLSHDGTEIVYWTSGADPPLVLVHGTPADHTRWWPLLPYLDDHVTVHAMDRRGRGCSEDAGEYRLEGEYEGVVAVIDAVAASSGQRVDVYGHSHGAIVAFGAAAMTRNLRRAGPLRGLASSGPIGLRLPWGGSDGMNEQLGEGTRTSSSRRSSVP